MTQSSSRQALEEPVDRLRRVRAVPQLVRRRATRAARAGWTSASLSIGRPRNASAASLRAAHAHLVARAVDKPTPARRARRSREASATASFSRAIASRLSPRTSVCSSPTFVRRTTGASRTFVASSRAAEAGFDRGHVDALGGELGQRRRRQRLELRRADAARLPPACDPTRARSPPRRCRAAPPSPRRGATCTRRLAALPPAAARRSSASPSTSRSYRRRGRTGMRAPGGRAPRAAHACGRGRTPPATARATRSRLDVAAPSSGMLTTAACTRTVERSSSEGGGRMLELASPTFTRAAAGLDR